MSKLEKPDEMDGQNRKKENSAEREKEKNFEECFKLWKVGTKELKEKNGFSRASAV